MSFRLLSLKAFLDVFSKSAQPVGSGSTPPPIHWAITTDGAVSTESTPRATRFHT
jgi:hypothetical protein